MIDNLRSTCLALRIVRAGKEGEGDGDGALCGVFGEGITGKKIWEGGGLGGCDLGGGGVTA